MVGQNGTGSNVRLFCVTWWPTADGKLALMLRYNALLEHHTQDAECNHRVRNPCYHTIYIDGESKTLGYSVRCLRNE